jgi:TRAP transporter 4TM/12TM fusion protein
MRELGRVWSAIAMLLAVSMAVYHLYTGLFGTPEALKHRSVHLLFALALVFILYPIKSGRDRHKVPIYDLAFIAVAVATVAYLFINYQHVMTRFFYVDPLSTAEMMLGAATILLVLEATRRVIGLTLPILAILFLGYAVAGPFMPGLLRHRGQSPETIIDQMYLVAEGIYGIPIGVSATYIILFIVFGAFLEKSGVGDFFIVLSKAIAGGARGGPAKVAVVSSAMFGTISGSAVANVVTTGNFTIPLMKRIGYKPHFAGAVEAASSTGGQIMPPIMGAAAFVMAEFTGIPYVEIIKHAALPAILYFGALFAAVHLEALKTGLMGLPKAEIPALGRTLLTGGHLLLPIPIILGLLFAGYTPMYAAIIATGSTIVLSWFRKETRMGPREIWFALERGAMNTVTVAVACATAGIIIGVVALTGLGLKFTSVVLALSGGSLIPALILTMIAGLILGMGLPTTPAYIVQAALLIPALITMGIVPIAAHMFAFYFAIISAITPPVALASYAAAGVARADVMRTGWTAMKLGATAYIVPFMFVFSPALLLVGPPEKTVLAMITASIGVFCLAAGLQRWLYTHANIPETVLLLAAAITLIYPDLPTDTVGLGMFAAVIVMQRIRVRRVAAAAAQPAVVEADAKGPSE